MKKHYQYFNILRSICSYNYVYLPSTVTNETGFTFYILFTIWLSKLPVRMNVMLFWSRLPSIFLSKRNQNTIILQIIISEWRYCNIIYIIFIIVSSLIRFKTEPVWTTTTVARRVERLHREQLQRVYVCVIRRPGFPRLLWYVLIVHTLSTVTFYVV